MHELSIAVSILEIVAEEAEWQGGARVVAIHLQLGPLSGVVKEALRSAYELAREGSAFEDTELVIKEVPLVVYCPACACERTLPSVQPLCCPACGGPTPQVVSGRQLEIIALEVES